MTYPQYINDVAPYAELLAIACLLAYCLYLRYLIFKEFPTNKAINAMKMEVDAFAGDLAELTERFSRFQKREGMRAARAERTQKRDVLEEAREILAQKVIPPEPPSSGPMAGKIHLYRQ